jgi:hypothetical protein
VGLAGLRWTSSVPSFVIACVFQQSFDPLEDGLSAVVPASSVPGLAASVSVAELPLAVGLGVHLYLPFDFSSLG